MSGGSFSELRTLLDGSEGFVSGGHRVIKTAGATRHAARMKAVPVWALDDTKVRELILKSFPKLHTDQRQRKQAALWVRVINLYWRTGMTRGQVAYEIGKTEVQTKGILQHISLAADGKRANGKGPRGLRKAGRPKKGVPIHTTSVGSHGDDHISL